MIDVGGHLEPRLATLRLVLGELGVQPSIKALDDRKRLQKAVYLAQRGGVDLGYRYGWYLKGPYSRRLTRDYYALAEADSLGETVNGERLRQDVVERLATVRQTFSVPDGLELEDHEWLELLASADYLSRIRHEDAGGMAAVLAVKKPRLAPHLDHAVAILTEHPTSA